jgi:hypothetical protein
VTSSPKEAAAPVLHQHDRAAVSPRQSAASERSNISGGRLVTRLQIIGAAVGVRIIVRVHRLRFEILEPSDEGFIEPHASERQNDEEAEDDREVLDDYAVTLRCGQGVQRRQEQRPCGDDALSAGWICNGVRGDSVGQ